MRAQVSAIGTLKPTERLVGWLAMQLRVNALGQLTRNTLHVAMSSIDADASPRMPPKRASSFWRRFGPMPSMPSSCDVLRVFARRARMPVMAKRCASSRICAISISACESRPRSSGGRSIGKHQFFKPDLALLALGHADEHRRIEPQLDEDLVRHRHLSLAAIDQDQVRQPAFAARDRRVAARQHLAHRGVVVARRRRLRCCSAGIRRSHRVFGEHHARRLCGLARRVADVEALDAQLVGIVLAKLETERVDQRARARLLRTLLRKPPRQREPRVGSAISSQRRRCSCGWRTICTRRPLASEASSTAHRYRRRR